MENIERKNRGIIRVLDIIDAISDWAGKIISFAIIPMVLITLALVLGRRLLQWIPMIAENGVLYNPDEDELPFFIVLITVYSTLGAGFALHRNQFINFDLVQNHFSPRTKALIEVLTYVLFFAAFGIIMYTVTQDLIGALTEGQAATFGNQTALNQLVGYTDIWTYIAWPIGMFLLLLEGLSRCIRDVLILVNGGKQNG